MEAVIQTGTDLRRVYTQARLERDVWTFAKQMDMSKERGSADCEWPPHRIIDFRFFGMELRSVVEKDCGRLLTLPQAL